MKNIVAVLLFTASSSLCSVANAQNGNSTGSPTPIDPSDEPAAVYNQPTIVDIPIYRSQIKTGIMVAAGAEVKFPNIAVPDMRSASTEESHLTIEDTKVDGTVAVSLWDLSTLTNRYIQPSRKPSGPYTNSLNDPQEEPDQTFDALDKEKPLTHPVQSSGDPNQESEIHTGSVFVDTNNRAFYTTPFASMFLPIPSGVDEIRCVTLQSRNDIIVAEWAKFGEPNYHVVGINVTTRSVVFDFMPESSMDSHTLLSWVDENTVLGELRGRKGSSYSVIDLVQHTVTATASANNFKGVRIKNNQVVIFEEVAER